MSAPTVQLLPEAGRPLRPLPSAEQCVASPAGGVTAIAAPMNAPEVSIITGPGNRMLHMPATSGEACAAGAGMPAQPAALAAPMNQPTLTTAPASLPRASCILRDEQGRFVGWLDYHHCLVSGQAMTTANWVDNLFGDWHNGEAKMLLRVINQVQWDRNTGSQFVSTVQAIVRLPNANKRLRLIISDDRDDYAVQSQNNSPRFLSQQSSATTAALRYIIVATRALRLDSDIGLRSGPDVYIRTRLRENFGLTDDTVLQTGETVRYAAQDRGRAEIETNIEHAVDGHGVLRLSNNLNYWEKEDHQLGARWNQGISWSQELSPLQSVAVGFGTEGVTRPVWARESYGPWVAYRTALWRDWVFYEIEPHLTRYRQNDWRTVPSVVLRLEIQFGRR
jgi:hypothetical protein